MFHKLLLWGLLAALLLSTTIPAWATESTGNELPDEPVETVCDNAEITATYEASSDQTRYRIVLKNDPAFEGGAPLTADDLLFSYYVYLDPGFTGEISLTGLNIVGEKNYRLQLSEQTLTEMTDTMNAIREAGQEHVWSEADGWTEAQQEAFWRLENDYLKACEAEYPKCAQAIVDFCAEQLRNAPSDAFGFTYEQISQSEGLQIAYAMVQWGYATYDETRGLIAKKSLTVWKMQNDMDLPTLEDFVYELQQEYQNDLARCWTFENPGNYTPELPDVSSVFIREFAPKSDSVSSIAGIDRIDERTLEVSLAGVELRSAHPLFGIEILSKDAYADPDLWNPEALQFGHPFGDTAVIEARLASEPENTLQLLDANEEPGFLDAAF